MTCASRVDEEAASRRCHPCRGEDCSWFLFFFFFFLSFFEFHDLKKRTVSQSACRAGPGTSFGHGRAFRHGSNSSMLVESTYSPLWLSL